MHHYRHYWHAPLGERSAKCSRQSPEWMILRSSSQSLLQVPRVKTGFGRRAFSSAAPQIWNHIPAAIKVSPSLDSFKHHLKTHYFTSP